MKGAVANRTRRLYQFGLFRLDASRHKLLRDDELVPLSPKAVETLILLVQNPGRVLERQMLMDALWPETIVQEANLAVAISQLRKAINTNRDRGEFIQTISRVGYRFVADVRTVEEQPIPLNATQQADVIIDENNKAVSPVEQLSPERSQAVVARAKPRKTLRLRLLVAAGSILALAAVVWLIRERFLVSRSVLAREKSIAVLPFENLSADSENVFFADGIQDELLTDLSRVADLKVISGASVMHYKSGMPRNLPEVARQLGVVNVVQGRVQRSGNRVRVNVQLLDARTNRQLWAQTYDRDVADVFALESELANMIAAQLQATLSPAEKKDIGRMPTADLIAFDLYARAKNLFLAATNSNSGKEDLLAAADLSNQAIARDPAYFEAYCQLSGIHDLLYILGHDHSPRRVSLAESAIDTALRLRPDAGEAHLARAINFYSAHLNYDQALAELELARKSLPNDCRIFEMIGLIENRRGKFEQALPQLEHAMELDPRNVYRLLQIAQTYWFLRRYPEAKATYDRAVAIDPSSNQVRVFSPNLEMAWKADTGAFQRVIESLRENNPRAVHEIADSWVLCALANRDTAAAKAAVTAAGENPPLNDNAVHFSRSFVEGWIARLEQDETKARAGFESARMEQEKIVRAEPAYAPALCVLGVIDAVLGNRQEALTECRRAAELLPVQKDAFNGSAIIQWYAISAAWVGEKDLALQQLSTAAHMPGTLSYGWLKLLPFWDPLREDPRFEKIVASLAPK